MWLKTYSLIFVTLLVANTDAFLINRFRLHPYDFKQGIQTEYQGSPERYDNVNLAVSKRLYAIDPLEYWRSLYRSYNKSQSKRKFPILRLKRRHTHLTPLRMKKSVQLHPNIFFPTFPAFFEDEQDNDIIEQVEDREETELNDEIEKGPTYSNKFWWLGPRTPKDKNPSNRFG